MVSLLDYWCFLIVVSLSVFLDCGCFSTVVSLLCGFSGLLTGKNYSIWEFQFKNHVKGKGLWSHLDDVSKAPT